LIQISSRHYPRKRDVRDFANSKTRSAIVESVNYAKSAFKPYFREVQEVVGSVLSARVPALMKINKERLSLERRGNSSIE
jgi:hypothetical protein